MEIFRIQRGQAAHGSALLAEMVLAGRQGNLGTQIGSFDLQIEQFLLLGTQIINRVLEHHIRLARLNARGQHANPQIARLQGRLHRTVFRAAQRPFLIIFNGAHKGVRNQNAVVQIERLAVRVTTGRTTNLDKFFDFRVVDRQINRRRTASQRALRNSQRQAVHYADEWHNAGGLAVFTDFFADGAQIAPIRANAAAT